MFLPSLLLDPLFSLQIFQGDHLRLLDWMPSSRLLFTWTIFPDLFFPIYDFVTNRLAGTGFQDDSIVKYSLCSVIYQVYDCRRGGCDYLLRPVYDCGQLLFCPCRSKIPSAQIRWNHLKLPPFVRGSAYRSPSQSIPFWRCLYCL